MPLPNSALIPSMPLSSMPSASEWKGIMRTSVDVSLP
jgi:hypothetical protein